MHHSTCWKYEWMPTTLQNDTSRNSHNRESLTFYMHFVAIPHIALYWDNLYSNDWNHSLSSSALSAQSFRAQVTVQSICTVFYSSLHTIYTNQVPLNCINSYLIIWYAFKHYESLFFCFLCRYTNSPIFYFEMLRKGPRKEHPYKYVNKTTLIF